MAEVENDEQFLSGGGQMGALIRSMDWSKTALGPVHQWPQSLRTSVSLCLSSTFPILIAWGPELIQIYNDAYRPICGAKHPESMGQNFKICWETALPVVGAAFDRGLAGEGTYIKDQQMLLDRNGYMEEAFMTFSFSPIRDESGNVGGIFHPITETTEQILSARRTQVVRDLAVHTSNAKTFDGISTLLAGVHDRFCYDVPFVQVYELDPASQVASLKVSAGIAGENLNFPTVDLSQPIAESWPLSLDVPDNLPVEVSGLSGRYGSFACGPFEEAPHTALIFPISICGGKEHYGFLVAGVSSGRALDQEYQNFFALFANTISAAFSNVDAYQQQQKRAQQLAEIDKAKTTFFSNVSHEFRTPLTLILGPLQQMRDEPHARLQLINNNLDSIYRNAGRLLKLVNNLLDFSRMEAGRVKASYQLVELGALTADLASNFRSVVESAGMQLIIEVREVTSEVYADVDMWEKIVLNLLSNAFKYTLQGSITVRIGQDDTHAILEVTDTGVGIPEEELPHMFERFHRIENTPGRTHEGTGIGLSLVSELVGLHFGSIAVASRFGSGSTFTVSIPLGRAHLPADQIISGSTRSAASSQQETFIREAMSLLDHPETAEPEVVEVSATSENEALIEVQKTISVLVVDDNADMRGYLGKLLSPYFTVDFASNGQDALGKITGKVPDLVISDVMMPVMDGRQLLGTLRQMSGPRIPVIILSARAGEESRIEGLQWGADDYLVKPFSAKELLTKVSSVIKINQVARKAETELREIFQRAPVAIGIFKGNQLVIEVANAMLLSYWNKYADEVVGRPFAEVFSDAGSESFGAIARDVFESGERKILREYPLPVAREGGPTRIYTNVVVEPVHDITGLITAVMLVANDVTELITALDLVRESEQRFRLLANSIPQLVWRIDAIGGEHFYNEFTYTFSGLSPDLLQAQGLILLMHPEDRPGNELAWQNAFISGEDFVYEHRFLRHDGQYRWHLSRGVAQRSASGMVENWIGASTDIHDQKTLEEVLEQRVALRTAELENINEQITKTNRELEQFAHVTSHDLQEPLRKIQVFSGMVRDQLSDQDRVSQDFIRRIIASSERMSHLIKDLLDFARIGSTDLVYEKTDLNDILLSVQEDFEFMISDTQAEIKAAVLPVIDAVPLQMNQLFYNLMGNALKFARGRSHIEITCDQLSAEECGALGFLKLSAPYIRIIFRDQGIGFDQEFAERIFTIFQTLNNRKAFAGNGIGLSICKKVVENHSGVIIAKGERDVGAAFEIYLPVEHTR
ncbi:ATP-binding protein [Dyadobacter sandarakinus]|uniref:histidine kinase n=1 Tax=Dyadobacter sandarakinus TaxID=2747268 RepID=A0ABX7I2R3_9BACT|nr:ATP-binding protein [Dyadobacter sandarakinus]QRQ99841.1 response regulator [Dyadobacter sandarakinus]